MEGERTRSLSCQGQSMWTARFIGFCLICISAVPDGLGQGVALESIPPVVIETVPRAGDAEVDPGLKEIRITFSKDMLDGSWSAVQLTEENFPKILGKPRYLDDGRTWVIDVQLSPGTVYAMWLNRNRFQGFKDTDQHSAVPYLLSFKTKGEADKKTAKKASDKAMPSPEEFLGVFDALVDDMRRHYSYFQIKKVDGDKLAEQYRPQVEKVSSTNEFVAVLKAMLSELRDGHVWIEHAGEQVPTFRTRSKPQNINLNATLMTLENLQRFGEFAVVGTTKSEGFAAIVVVRQSTADQASVDRVVEFIQAQQGAPGFLVDLRLANGGNESLAQQIAGQFCSEDIVYARSKFRDGPRPSDFGPSQSRVLRAVDPSYTKPVVCILGPGCVSSGEGFAKMMQCLPHVTTVGATTRGSSGNPAPFELPGIDVAVWYSRWVDMLPDGTPIEDAGVVPEIEVAFPRDAYRDEDPTWQRAIEVLREKVASPE